MGKTPQPAHHLYLGMAALQGMSSLPALLHARNGSLPWSEALQGEAKALEAKLKLHPIGALTCALQQEAEQQFSALEKGIADYLAFPYLREPADVPVLWSEGATQVLDFTRPGNHEKPFVLFIPSLINRAYILDLDSKRSFAHFLASEGFAVALVDWGDPGEAEHAFGCGEYITERLEKILPFLKQKTGKPVTLAGYCMGGLLALAAGLRCMENVSALALLATPWDFHSGARVAFSSHHMVAVEQLLQRQQSLPKDTIRQWFYMLQIQAVHRKFQAFSTLDKTSEAAHDFVAIQHWIDDGVEMTANVAQECFIAWAYHNTPMQGIWEVDGATIQPDAWKRPCFIAIPQHDRIVPPASSAPLLQHIPHASVITPNTGHIGMVAGRHARKELWQPFAVWLKKVQESPCP